MCSVHTARPKQENPSSESCTPISTPHPHLACTNAWEPCGGPAWGASALLARVGAGGGEHAAPRQKNKPRKKKKRAWVLFLALGGKTPPRAPTHSPPSPARRAVVPHKQIDGNGRDVREREEGRKRGGAWGGDTTHEGPSRGSWSLKIQPDPPTIHPNSHAHTRPPTRRCPPPAPRPPPR